MVVYGDSTSGQWESVKGRRSREKTLLTGHPSMSAHAVWKKEDVFGRNFPKSSLFRQ